MPGLLVPPSTQASRVPTYVDAAARDAVITQPYTGLIVYRTTGDILEFYNGSTWTRINENGIKIYASAAARTSALPTPAEGTVTYLLDDNVVEYYDGAEWNAVGSGGGLPTDFLLVGA